MNPQESNDAHNGSVITLQCIKIFLHQGSNRFLSKMKIQTPFPYLEGIRNKFSWVAKWETFQEKFKYCMPLNNEIEKQKNHRVDKGHWGGRYWDNHVSVTPQEPPDRFLNYLETGQILSNNTSCQVLRTTYKTTIKTCIIRVALRLQTRAGCLLDVGLPPWAPAS